MEADYQLSAAIRRCEKCPSMLELRLADGTSAVPAEVGFNAPDQPLGIMCEAPGAQEAATSRPLVGPAGRIFNELLEEAGLKRDELILLNRVRCRPPGNKMSNSPESKPNCEEWMEKELLAYNPIVVVVMGGTAMEHIFGATAKVGQTRGKWRKVDGRAWTATYHPASLFPYRSPQNRPLVVADLIEAARVREEMLAA